MGLAAVGRLSSRYGLSVNFRPSSRGGTGVVVMVPRQLIAQPRLDTGGSYSPASEPEQAGSPASEPEQIDQPSAGQPSAGQPAGAGQPSAGQPAGAGQPSAGQAAGLERDLPKRPRGVTLAAASNGQSGPAVAAPPSPPFPEAPRDNAARFAAFREAGERSRSAPSESHDDETR